MLKTLLSRISLLIVIFTLVACSTDNSIPVPKQPFRNQKNAYMKSPEKNEQLKFPPDLRQTDISHDFDVTPVTKPHNRVSLTPPGSLASRWSRDDVGIKPPSNIVIASNKIHIQPEKNKRLLMSVDESEEKLWEALEPALERQECKVMSASLEDGRYYVVDDFGARFQVLVEPQNDNKTIIRLAGFQGKPLSEKLEQRLYQQIGDGLRGKSSLPIVARVLKGIQEKVTT